MQKIRVSLNHRNFTAILQSSRYVDEVVADDSFPINAADYAHICRVAMRKARRNGLVKHFPTREALREYVAMAAAGALGGGFGDLCHADAVDACAILDSLGFDASYELETGAEHGDDWYFVNFEKRSEGEQ